MKIIVTGGAGFIGSAVIRRAVEAGHEIVNADCLTYAANLENLSEVSNNPNYTFTQTNICDAHAIHALFEAFKPDAVLHLAAESHVDRSIDGPGTFVQTNIVGTYNLLEAARAYWLHLDKQGRSQFRFHHVSTDEVYGTLGQEGLFTEETPYKPNSPYAATKASSDHLVRAWGKTFSLPVVTSNCSNNYGPYQFPEKLIPVVFLACLNDKDIPVYGRGENIRDWLYVEDHADALLCILQKGKLGEAYNIGGYNECKNIDIVKMICALMDELTPKNHKHETLIKFVSDRPGHDMRYAIDATKIKKVFGWAPSVTLEEGIRKTIKWYLDNRSWWQNILEGEHELKRLGLKFVE